MAAPHIAGLAALLKSANSALTPAQVERRSRPTRARCPGTCSGGCGAGLADATKSLTAATGN